MARFKVQRGMERTVAYLRDLPERIEDLPRAWFQVIEPRIKRDPRRYANCWMWRGATTNYGEPKVSAEGETIRAKNVVARMFVDLFKLKRGTFEVVHLCKNRSCLNPSHLMLRFDHHSQRDADALRGRHLAPGEYYEP